MALKFNGETMAMACASEKVKLKQLAAPPKSLKPLWRYRLGHQDTNDIWEPRNINDDRDTQREITNLGNGTQMTTETQE